MIIRKIEIIFSVFFLVLLVLPLSGSKSIGQDSFTSINQEVNIKDILKGLGKFQYNFSENYRFRDELITVNGIIKTKLLRTTSSSKVLLGKEDWLFLASEKAMDNHRNIYDFSDQELAVWEKTLAAREKYCGERGISYFFTISPDKSNIYPEYLPDHYTEVQPLSRKAVLKEKMKEWGIEYVELEESLLDNKKTYPLYYRTDTHWNELGAYYGYLSIMQSLKAEFPEIRMDDSPVSIIQEEIHGGDLARLMGLAGRMKDTLYHVSYDKNATLLNGEEIKLEMIDVQHTGRLNTKCESGEIGKAVIFHDSFGVALIPFLAEHFQEALFVRSDNFDSKLISEYKPDVVIQQLVERRLLNRQPNPDEIQ